MQTILLIDTHTTTLGKFTEVLSLNLLKWCSDECNFCLHDMLIRSAHIQRNNSPPIMDYMGHCDAWLSTYITFMHFCKQVFDWNPDSVWKQKKS